MIAFDRRKYGTPLEEANDKRAQNVSSTGANTRAASMDGARTYLSRNIHEVGTLRCPISEYEKDQTPHQLCGAQLQQARVQLSRRGVVLGVSAVSESEDRESHALQAVAG